MAQSFDQVTFDKLQQIHTGDRLHASEGRRVDVDDPHSTFAVNELLHGGTVTEVDSLRQSTGALAHYGVTGTFSPVPVADWVGLSVTSAEITSSRFWLTLNCITSHVRASVPPASLMLTSHGSPDMNSPCSSANDVSPSLLSTVNSIDASFSVPTVARQPLLSRVDASASAFSSVTVKSLQFLISGAVDRQNRIEPKFDFWHGSRIPSVLNVTSPSLARTSAAVIGWYRERVA